MEVPAGKEKVMERFFSPVRQQTLERGGVSNEMDLRGQEGMKGKSDMLFYSSLSSTSFSSEASAEEDSFMVCKQLDTRKLSQLCVDVRTFREGNVDLDRPAYSRFSVRSEDRLFQEEEEEAEELGDATFDEPGGAEPSAEFPTPRPLEYPVHEPGRRSLGNGSRSDNLRKAKSMEVIAVKQQHGPGASPAPAAGRAVPGASSDGKKHKSNRRASGELTAAKERLVQQKVKFSQFLDDITLQVLSPANLNSLNLKPPDHGSGEGIGGKGNANKKYKVKAGISQDSLGGKAWPEEAPGQHRVGRRESGSRSASPNTCPPSSWQPGNHSVAVPADPTASPEQGSDRQPRQEGQRQAGGTRISEHSPGPAKQNPPATRCHSKPSTGPQPDITLCIEQNPPPPPKGSVPPARRRYKQGGSKLTDSASSLENCPALSARLGKYTDSSSSLEGSLAIEGHPHTAGPNSCNTKSAGRLLAIEDIQGVTHPRPTRPLSGRESPESSQEVGTLVDLPTQAREELLTDTHRLRLPQEEKEDLQRRLACATYRMEKMGSECQASHGYLETELQRARADLEDLREKLWRLQENYSSAQQANQFVEEKLCTIAQNMETERKSLNQRISELSNRLTAAQNTIGALERRNLPHLQQTASTDGHDQLETSCTHSSLLDVSIFTPPPSFMDEGPETDAGRADRPTPSAGGPGAGAERLHCRVGATIPEDDGPPCPEEQASTASRVVPTRPPRTSGIRGPHRLMAFTTWKPCPKAIPAPEWSETTKGNGPRTDRGLADERHLPSRSAGHGNPFGPVTPEEYLTAATSAVRQGRNRELDPNTLQPPPTEKDRDPKSQHMLSGPWWEISCSAGSEDEALDSRRKTLAGKVPGAGQELDYRSPLNGLPRACQRNGGCSASRSPSPAPQGVDREPSDHSVLTQSRHWASRGEEGLGRRLSEDGERARDEQAPWPAPQGVRPAEAPECLSADLGAPGRARPPVKHRPPTAPRKRSSQAVHGPAARDQTS